MHDLEMIGLPNGMFFLLIHVSNSGIRNYFFLTCGNHSPGLVPTVRLRQFNADAS